MALSFLKKILIILKINLLIITSLTSSAQAATLTDIASQSVGSHTILSGMHFNANGTVLITIDKGNNLREFSLSTAYDITSAAATGTTNSVASQSPSAAGIDFSSDGKTMYITGTSGVCKVYQYNVTNAFDIANIAYANKEMTFSSQACGAVGSEALQINNNGTKLYVAAKTNDTIYEYNLSTANDVSSASYSSNSLDIQSTTSNVCGVEYFRFNSAGTKLFVGSPNRKFCQYNLTSAFDLSTATFSSSSTLSGARFATAIELSSDDTKLYLGDYVEREVFQLAFDPTLSSSTPADNATNVARDANIVLNFSKIVDVETGNITIKKTSDDSTFETIDVTSSNVTGSGTTQITINPTSNFIGDTEFYVLIDATAFDDVSSGSYAGISSTTALSFTTESMVDPTTDKDVIGLTDTQSQLAKSIINQSTSTVSNRLSYLRQNKDSNDLTENNIKLDFGNAILTSLANQLLAKNDKSIIPDNWSSWSEGSLSSSKIGDSTNSSSSETDAQALAFGFDTKLNDNDLLGFAIQYGKSDTDIGSSGSKTDSENINFSVYRTRPLDNDNFIEGMFGVGLIESDLTRISGSNTLTGSRNGTQIFGSINYGRTLDKGDFNLTPIARVDLGYTELDAYSESGTDALSYAKQTIESGLASVGLQFSDIVKFNGNKLKPFGSIEYGMDFSNSSDAKMNYVSDTSTIYTYTQGANSNHLITSVVGFEYITINNLNIISSYKRIQGNESEQTDILNVSINFRSQRETEYAMSIDGSEDLKAGFDISKNINGFDLNFNANRSLSENSDQAANVSLSRSF
ncbi:autotransporter domain-containing protein [Candidatus Pelagibacter sp.]|nr:autotransporter domain-containing protein [Candidatus Pelagibacter sp.]